MPEDQVRAVVRRRLAVRPGEDLLGEGVVVRVAEGRAWIALNESAVSKRVISGDSVKVVYEKDFWDKVQDFSADVAAGN